MIRPGFWREAGIALALSAIGSVVWHAVATLTGGVLALRVVIAGLGLIYAVLLLRGLNARIGRVLAVGAWLAMDLALFVADPPTLVWLFAQTAAIWLLRCWCCHRSAIAALADSALGLFAIMAAVVGVAHSHSLFLALWSYFLVQALFVLIPDSLRAPAGAAVSDDEDRFSRAHRTAEAALRRLASRY